MAFDENGNIYVAEMMDYPEDPPAGKPARSRIRLLQDTNGTAKSIKTTIFADQVLAVSGFMPWKGGLIVTSAPDILFMKDENGDGKADVRKVLYTGFPKVNHEARITNPRLGPRQLDLLFKRGIERKNHVARPSRDAARAGARDRFPLRSNQRESGSGFGAGAVRVDHR